MGKLTDGIIQSKFTQVMEAEGFKSFRFEGTTYTYRPTSVSLTGAQFSALSLMFLEVANTHKKRPKKARPIVPTGTEGAEALALLHTAGLASPGENGYTITQEGMHVLLTALVERIEAGEITV